MLHAVLIDDEASARADLREKLRAHPNVVVVGEAATLGAARALLISADYQLVILDVQLIGGVSFDLIPSVRPGASIVFATAHAGYAVRAFESHAVDYLLKPILPGRLADALHRVAGSLAAHAPVFRSTAANSLPVTSPTARAAAQQHAARREMEDGAEVRLSREESAFLEQMLEAWEDSLAPTHRLRLQPMASRTVHYDRGERHPHLFLRDAQVGVLHRCWRGLCRRFTL